MFSREKGRLRAQAAGLSCLSFFSSFAYKKAQTICSLPEITKLEYQELHGLMTKLLDY